jgi:hypothetical protein
MASNVDATLYALPCWAVAALAALWLALELRRRTG